MKKFVTFVGILTIIYDFVIVKLLDLMGLGFADVLCMLMHGEESKKVLNGSSSYDRRAPRNY